jgi:hypothetical protein
MNENRTSSRPQVDQEERVLSVVLLSDLAKETELPLRAVVNAVVMVLEPKTSHASLPTRMCFHSEVDRCGVIEMYEHTALCRQFEK